MSRLETAKKRLEQNLAELEQVVRSQAMKQKALHEDLEIALSEKEHVRQVADKVSNHVAQVIQFLETSIAK